MAILQGKAWYAKIVGKPVKDYEGTNTEWTMDLCINAEGRAQLEAEGLGDKIKNKGDERGDFISFKRKGIKKDGEESKNIKIVDSKKEPWGTDLIGNGSVVNVKYAVDDWTFGKKTGIKASILAVQVVDLVPYEGGEDFEVVGEW